MLESRTDLKVVTDCQSNLDLWARTAHHGAALSYMNHANEDLVQRLARRPRTDDQRVIKIKSHINSIGVTDDYQAFLHLGNEIVDAAAKQAVQQIPQPVQAASFSLVPKRTGKSAHPPAGFAICCRDHWDLS